MVVYSLKIRKTWIQTDQHALTQQNKVSYVLTTDHLRKHQQAPYNTVMAYKDMSRKDMKELHTSFNRIFNKIKIKEANFVFTSEMKLLSICVEQYLMKKEKNSVQIR